VRLMPPAYVKPYVKRQKNDMADAEAICEAVARANMRFVPTKTPAQQSCLRRRRARYRPWSAWRRRRGRAGGHGTELPIWNVRCHGEIGG
jgi:transposase